MRQVSAALRRYITAGTHLPEVNITLVLPQQGGGVTLSPTLAMESIVWKRGNSDGGQFTVGGCNISTFSFSCFETEWAEYDWTDAYFDVELEYDGFDPLKIGRFYVGMHDYNINSIIVTGYDAMIYLDNQSISGDDFTATLVSISAVINKIIENTPIVLSAETQTLLNNSRYTNNTIDKVLIKSMTKRALLSYILQLCFAFAFMIEDNQLTIRKLKNYVPAYESIAYSYNAVCLDSAPIFSEKHNPIMLNGFKFTNQDEEYEQSVGDESGYIIEIDNPIFSASIGSYVLTDAEEWVGLYMHAGEIQTVSNPLIEPGDIFYYTDWKIADSNKADCFLANQITWKGQNTKMSVRCDVEISPYNDMRSINKQSEEQTSNVFYSGTVTLSASGTGSEAGTYYAYILTDDKVPSKYKRSYVVIATPTSGGNIVSIVTRPENAKITGDTQNMVVSYQLCKNNEGSSSAETASVLTDYGTAGAAYVSQIEEEYTQ